MAFISYDEKADKQYRDFLKRMQKVTDDLTPYLVAIAEELRQSRKLIFKLKTNGAYPDFKGPTVAETWSDNASDFHKARRTRKGNMTAYQNSKVKAKHSGVNGKGYPLLRATGRLEKSVTESGGENVADIVNKKTLVFGTTVEHGAYHQSDLSRKTMPLRKFLFIGSDETKSGERRGIERIMKAGNIMYFRELGYSLAEAKKLAEGATYEP
jgi:phage gpG-like protein